MTKVCTKCGVEKDLDEFHNSKNGKYGKAPDCKKCNCAARRAYCRKNPEKVAESKKRWHEQNLESNRASRRNYYQTCNLKKHQARRQLKYAVRKGEIIKPRHCEGCGAEKEKSELDGHHKDYSKPFDVIWLCSTCHGKEHIQYSLGKNPFPIIKMNELLYNLFLKASFPIININALFKSQKSQVIPVIATSKVCNICKVEKPLDEFYVNKVNKDGKRSDCKVCNRAYQKARTRANPKAVRESQRKSYYKNHRKKIEYQRKWREQNPEKIKEYQDKTDDSKRDPKKVQARMQLRHAVRDGKVVKPDHCEECRTKTEKAKLEGHHEDYSKPYDVVWLCSLCHGKNRRKYSGEAYVQ